MELKKFITKEKTQKDVAFDLNISPQTLSNYINGKTDPDILTLIKLADYFHTTIDSLCGHEVPYLLDKSLLSDAQNKIIKKLPLLSERQSEKVDAYITALLDEKY